jgi:hypothetical protein
MAYLSMAFPDVYRRSVRAPYTYWYTIDAYGPGGIVAADLRPIGGQIVDTTKPGVRRTLSLELAPTPGLFDKLAPLGTQLGVYAQVRLANREIVSIPMGAYDIDVERMTEGGGKLSVTAVDRWGFIQRARFARPYSSTPGMRVTDQIVNLLRGAIGDAPPINITATSTATVGALTWEKDRDKAIIELATSIGAWVYFDRPGTATIADLPDLNRSADWLVDASASGVLIELDRERSKLLTRNVVVVESSAASDAEKFNTQIVWDSDPSSPTYAGPDPINNPTAAGLFGVVTHFFDTPLPLTDAQAQAAGYTVLASQTGLASQVSLGMFPNMAMDAGDALDVLPPRERYDIRRVLERHVADTITYPLVVSNAQTIEGRSTRTDS